VAPSIYYAPGAPQHQLFGPVPNYDESINPYMNDTGITKLQYTYALSTAAYMRVYGYTLYSDWLQTSPVYGATGGSTPTLSSGQYDLMTHTSGAAFDFNDQVNDQNLVAADYNFTTAGVIRFNNTSAYAGAGTTPIGYMGGGSCYDSHSGKTVPCLASTYYNVALGTFVDPREGYTGATGTCDTSPTAAPCGWVSNAVAGPLGFPKAGASWDTLWQGNVTGSYNTVRPQFQNASISDQWRPSDKFLINASMRYDNFAYILPQSLTAATSFYANMTSNYTCVQPSTNQVLQEPLPPGAPPPAPAYAEVLLNRMTPAVVKL
jgi:hypothetical protein